MSLKSLKILGISITANPKKEILEYIRKYLEKSSAISDQQSAKLKKPLVIVTPNPEQIVFAQKDPHFAKILNQADVAIPDGIGLAWASRFLKDQKSKIKDQKELQRIPGVEFMEDLVRLAAQRGYPIALIGGRSGVAVEALECLKKRHTGLHGWAVEAPEFDLEYMGSPAKYELRIRNYDEGQKDRTSSFVLHNSKFVIPLTGDLEDHIKQLARRIVERGTRLIFVGLGAPKQEYLIENAKCQMLNAKCPLIFMSVGGAFDIIAGRVKRAPAVVRWMGFEWLWRLVRQPWRLRRQLALVKFLWLLAIKG